MLASANSVANPLLRECFAKHTTELVFPTTDEQPAVTSFIHKKAKGEDVTQDALGPLIRTFALHNCEGILLACTDLEGISFDGFTMFDSSVILAQETARRILA